MKIADIPSLRDASIESKLELVEELWADITAKSNSIALPDWHVKELDRSWTEYQANPDEGSSWEEARARLLNRRKPS